MALVVNSLPTMQRWGFDPGSGRSPGGGHGNPLQYSYQENPMERGACWATVYGATESRAKLKRLSTRAHSTKQARSDQQMLHAFMSRVSQWFLCERSSYLEACRSALEMGFQGQLVCSFSGKIFRESIFFIRFLTEGSSSSSSPRSVPAVIDCIKPLKDYSGKDSRPQER